MDYSKFFKKHEFDLLEVAKTPLFNNAKINRKLNSDAVRAVFDDLVSQGNAEWLTKEKSRVTVYWRRPEEWAALVYKWVNDTGKMDSVLTFFEIQQGDETVGQEFHELDTRILKKALQSLEAQRKAQVFTGTSDDNLGVKFFSV